MDGRGCADLQPGVKILFTAFFLGLLVLYFGLQFLALGFFADKIMLEFYPDLNPVMILGVFLIY